MIDFARWVEEAKADPVEFRRRQVVEIILHAISSYDDLKDHLLLKGGTLMNLGYGSPRATDDVDFTATVAVDDFEEQIKQNLDDELPKAVARLGYLDLTCRVQGTQLQPPRPDARFPTLEVRVASASKSSASETKRLDAGRAPNIVKLEISFNEYTETPQPLFLDHEGKFIFTYSLSELIAEKYRALLQQLIRNRYRGQDVYDIARLIRQHQLNETHGQVVFRIMIRKCQSRDMNVTRDDIDDPEIMERAQTDYESLDIQLGTHENSFDDDFQLIRDFYRSMPWQ